MGCASSAPAQMPPPGGMEHYAPAQQYAPASTQQYAPLHDDAAIDFSKLNIKQLQVPESAMLTPIARSLP